MRPDPLYIWLAALAICFGIVSLVLLLPIGHAVELSITGNASGQGSHLLNFTGEQLNVSILQNGSIWNVTLGGQA